MAIKIKHAAPQQTELEQEPYYQALLVRAQRVLKCDSQAANRAFFGYVDGLLKAGGLNTRDLRISRQIRTLADLVRKSIDTGVLDPVLETILDEIERK